MAFLNSQGHVKYGDIVVLQSQISNLLEPNAEEGIQKGELLSNLMSAEPPEDPYQFEAINTYEDMARSNVLGHSNVHSITHVCLSSKA